MHRALALSHISRSALQHIHTNNTATNSNSNSNSNNANNNNTATATVVASASTASAATPVAALSTQPQQQLPRQQLPQQQQRQIQQRSFATQTHDVDNNHPLTDTTPLSISQRSTSSSSSSLSSSSSQSSPSLLNLKNALARQPKGTSKNSNVSIESRPKGVSIDKMDEGVVGPGKVGVKPGVGGKFAGGGEKATSQSNLQTKVCLMNVHDCSC